jgi:integrase
MKVTSLENDAVFLLHDRKGVRVPSLEGVKNCWPRACESLKLEKPWPRFHDLRHTWKTNARRSGMDPEIRESILGHWFKEKSVVERYGRISDDELVRAVDRMTFDHGQTEIFVVGR